jgi:hypothetical protein
MPLAPQTKPQLPAILPEHLLAHPLVQQLIHRHAAAIIASAPTHLQRTQQTTAGSSGSPSKGTASAPLPQATAIGPSASAGATQNQQHQIWLSANANAAGGVGEQNKTPAAASQDLGGICVPPFAKTALSDLDSFDIDILSLLSSEGDTAPAGSGVGGKSVRAPATPDRKVNKRGMDSSPQANTPERHHATKGQHSTGKNAVNALLNDASETARSRITDHMVEQVGKCATHGKGTCYTHKSYGHMKLSGVKLDAGEQQGPDAIASQFVGVYPRQSLKGARYLASLFVTVPSEDEHSPKNKQKRVHLGTFSSAERAAVYADAAMRRLYGNGAYQNFTPNDLHSVLPKIARHEAQIAADTEDAKHVTKATQKATPRQQHNKVGRGFKVGDLVSIPAWTFSHRWAVEHYKAMWKTATVKGEIRGVAQDETLHVIPGHWEVMFEDGDISICKEKHLRKIPS